MKLSLLATAGILTLGGCASNGDYARYAAAQENIAAARYSALAAAASGGNETTKVAVAMAIALGGNGTGGNNGIAAPRDPNDIALGWASILVPGLTQAYGISQNAKVAINNSNNQTAQAMRQTDNSAATLANTNATMLGIATLITVPEPTIVTQPAPVIVNQPAPVIVTQPAPVVVDPVIVTQPAPIIVQSPAGTPVPAGP